MQTLSLQRVEQILQNLQRQALGVGMEDKPVSIRLDEIRNNLEKFTVDTKMTLRQEAITINERNIDEDKSSDNSQATNSKIARLLSTRYGKTCFDVIIAKTPTQACLHDVELKLLQDQVKLQADEIANIEKAKNKQKS